MYGFNKRVLYSFESEYDGRPNVESDYILVLSLIF